MYMCREMTHATMRNLTMWSGKVYAVDTRHQHGLLHNICNKVRCVSIVHPWKHNNYILMHLFYVSRPPLIPSY